MKFTVTNSNSNVGWAGKGIRFYCDVCHKGFIDTATTPRLFLESDTYSLMHKDQDGIRIDKHRAVACSEECVNLYILQYV